MKVHPTQKLQQLLLAAVLAAAGFIFTASGLQSVLWAAAGLMVLWLLLGDQCQSWLAQRRDPYRRSGASEKLALGAEGISTTTGLEEHSDTTRPYSLVSAVYDDGRDWFVCLRTGEIWIIGRENLVQGTEKEFVHIIRTRTSARITPLDPSMRSRLRSAQDARRGYLESRRGKGLFKADDVPAAERQDKRRPG